MYALFGRYEGHYSICSLLQGSRGNYIILCCFLSNVEKYEQRSKVVYGFHVDITKQYKCQDMNSLLVISVFNLDYVINFPMTNEFRDGMKMLPMTINAVMLTYM